MYVDGLQSLRTSNCGRAGRPSLDPRFFVSASCRATVDSHPAVDRNNLPLFTRTEKLAYCLHLYCLDW